MATFWGMLSALYGLGSMVLGLLLNPISLLALLALYQWRRTGLEPGPLSASQQRWRQVALAVLLLMVAGFGLCGGGGTLMGLYSVFTAHGEARAYGWMFVVVGGAGLVLAGGVWWLIRRYRRDEGRNHKAQEWQETARDPKP